MQVPKMIASPPPINNKIYFQVYTEEQVKLDFHPLSSHDQYFRCVQDKYAGYPNLQPQLTHNAALAVHRDNFG